MFFNILKLSRRILKDSYKIRIASDIQWLWSEISICYLNEDDRRRIIEEFCMYFVINIANGITPYDESDTWTFKNSWGHLRRFDYILHSKSLRSFDVSTNDELHLGSDHRNVSASIEYIRSMESWKLRDDHSKDGNLL